MNQYIHTYIHAHILVELFNMHPVRERNNNYTTQPKTTKSHNMKYSFDKEYLKRINVKNLTAGNFNNCKDSGNFTSSKDWLNH